ncbi:MAG: PSD1 and planctomycete cytochrome C domain-containing protein, partial [Opitutales bacterium]
MIFGLAATVFGVDFNREVRPILSEHCFQCHGLDQQKSKLRLDFEEFAHKGGKSGLAAVAPGKPDHSEIIHRVTDRGEDRMPPKGKGLSRGQVEVLRRWIGEGGKYDKHWAYVFPKRSVLPTVKAKERVANAIDHFTLRRLEEHGLTFSEPADKARWLRRVSLDLLGLPPTVEQLDDFLVDKSENAREKVVDALQQSSRYGEHWARQWLDLARYADSNGFQADQLRDSWAFRDWVIDAMNADMPFDQFTIEQIAGDLLPKATFSQKVATGFHRTPTCNVEAGVHPEENRVNQVVDRVNATGTTWLGTTMECAQCHSHKYDPVPQEEYYRLFAFFNNTPLEVKGGGGVTFNFWGPTMDLPSDKASKPKKQAAETALKAKEKELVAAKKAAEAKFEDWLVSQRKKLSKEKGSSIWAVLKPTKWKSSGKETFTLQDDDSLLAGGTSGDKSIYEIETEAPKGKLASLRLETLLHDSLPSKGPGRNRTNSNPNFVLNELTVSLLEPGKKPMPLKLTRAKVDFSQGNFSANGLIDGKRDLRSAWAISPEFGKAHWATLDLAKPVEPALGSKLLFKLEHLYGGGRNVGRPRFSASPEPARQPALPKEIANLLRKPKPTARETKKLLGHYLKSDDELADLEKSVAAAKKKVDAIKPATTLVMVEMDKPRETRVMSRGNYLDPKQKVAPGTPAALHPWKKEWPANRLGFAKWLVDQDNPLVARVVVNRWWGQFFGSGIVSTEEDFGSQCEPPTHPELLDWLAVEFMESGWSMKKLHKLIVLSATYGQSSRVTPELLEKDPNNLWFARGPRFRLTAEMIR